jgi:hypothetical protein
MPGKIRSCVIKDFSVTSFLRNDKGICTTNQWIPLGRGVKAMKANCTACGREINLDHQVFHDYTGPVKCFSCGAMMEMKAAEGVVYSMNPLAILEYPPDHRLSEPG